MRAAIDDFVAQRTLAIAGVSRSGKSFSNAALKELKAKGYRVFAVNPNASEIDGMPCYASFTALPESVGGALVIVPPEHSESVVRAAAAAGIARVWLQQGAESPAATEAGREAGISLVHGHCILMFAEPVRSFHRFHRFIWRLLGKLPEAACGTPQGAQRSGRG
ncbi:MAG: CoA-binding protein [Acidobacteriota bacterium]